MVVHLLANASILNGVDAFQNVVYMIHSLGNMLWLVEWLFIFLPILFHAALGFVFIFQAKHNTKRYPFMGNYRYRLQRITGIVAFLFIFWHVLHLNGIIHAEWFRATVADGLGIARFRPYNAASTAAEALQSPLISALYTIGLLACVFHFANGLWTMGITWGVWLTPRAQALASHICLGLGAVVAVIGLSAMAGFWNVDVNKARERELEMYRQRVLDGSILENPHKLSRPLEDQPSNGH